MRKGITFEMKIKEISNKKIYVKKKGWRNRINSTKLSSGLHIHATQNNSTSFVFINICIHVHDEGKGWKMTLQKEEKPNKCKPMNEQKGAQNSVKPFPQTLRSCQKK